MKFSLLNSLFYMRKVCVIFTCVYFSCVLLLRTHYTPGALVNSLCMFCLWAFMAPL